eukprot:scpid85927/ scgid27659/ 
MEKLSCICNNNASNTLVAAGMVLFAMGSAAFLTGSLLDRPVVETTGFGVACLAIVSCGLGIGIMRTLLAKTAPSSKPGLDQCRRRQPQVNTKQQLASFAYDFKTGDVTWPLGMDLWDPPSQQDLEIYNEKVNDITKLLTPPKR